MHLDVVLIIISMQCTFTTATHILNIFLYCTIPDHIDGTVIQHATNNVDTCTHCAYLFFNHLKRYSIHTIDKHPNIKSLSNAIKAAFHFCAFHTHVYGRKTLNPSTLYIF